MKVTFVTNTLGLTGGIKVVYEHANNLSNFGHEVTIVHLLKLNGSFSGLAIAIMKKIKYILLKCVRKDGVKWFNLNKGIKIFHLLNLKKYNSYDAIIATANETADWVNRLNGNNKFYFIQDYEIWTRLKDQVDITWKLPLKKIVIAEWLKNLARKKFQQDVVGIVYDGVDQKKFYNNNKKFNHCKKFLMMYHILEKKGFLDGLEAYLIAKQKHPEIALTLFGAYRLKNNIVKNIEYFYLPSPRKLRELYSASDIFLWPSWEDGFGLPPLEAMACKCAVISTDTGAIRSYAIHNETALIIPPHRPDLMAGEIIKLIEDDDKIKKISFGGFSKASEFTWEKSSRELINILINYCS